MYDSSISATSASREMSYGSGTGYVCANQSTQYVPNMHSLHQFQIGYLLRSCLTVHFYDPHTHVDISLYAHNIQSLPETLVPFRISYFIIVIVSPSRKCQNVSGGLYRFQSTK